KHAFGAGGCYRRLKARPVGVVGEDKAAFDRPSPPRAANTHPTRRKPRRMVAKPIQPWRASGRRRRKNHRALPLDVAGKTSGPFRGGQSHALAVVRSVEPLNSAVAKDRPNRSVEAVEDS